MELRNHGTQEEKPDGLESGRGVSGPEGPRRKNNYSESGYTAGRMKDGAELEDGGWSSYP